MYRYDDLVQGLLAVAGRGGERPADLERTLAPLVRLALRRGGGAPALVRWVRQALAGLAGPNPEAPEAYAPQITRLLVAALLEQQPRRPRAEETLVGL